VTLKKYLAYRKGEAQDRIDLIEERWIDNSNFHLAPQGFREHVGLIEVVWDELLRREDRKALVIL
jgi:hypothetical protein